MPARKFEKHVYVVTCQSIMMEDWWQEVKVESEVKYVFDDREKADAWVAYAEKEFALEDRITKYFVHETQLNPNYESEFAEC